MFDLTTGATERMPSASRKTVLLSSLLQIIGLGLIVVVPSLYAAQNLPNVPKMTAFVVAPPPVPPPPPPAPPAVKDAAAKVMTTSPNAAPVEAPSSIAPEPADAGVVSLAGVEGGVTGGVVGGLAEALPPPPPPPPRGPVHVGGDIHPPALVRRVEPVYPAVALAAHVEGTVILEAIIDEDGSVQSVKLLRSIPLLDKAAVTAVEQWRYSPVMLNGSPVRVVLTVTVTFKIPTV